MTRSNLFFTNNRFYNSGIALLFLTLVSACTTSNVNDGLRPTASIGNQNQQPQNQQPLAQPNQPPANTLSLAAPTDSALSPSPGVTFLPVLGPPQSAISQLSSSIRNSAQGNSVTIIPKGQTGATYQVKGYFSALDDGTGTRLIFIWDVLDRNGRKIHRISGEERTSSRNANPWSAIDSGMITNIVERTMQNLRGWMSTRA